jgi:hypothetical protein
VIELNGARTSLAADDAVALFDRVARWTTIPREKFLRLTDLLLERNIGWEDWNGG